MDNFKKKFIEEGYDLLNELETVLLQFASNPEDKELIEHIFRIMHTLKGNSAMFGFSQIDQYTHQLESIYDLLRNGKMKANDELMDLTLASVDHIRNLLDEENSKKEEVIQNHQRLLEKIALIACGDNRQTEEKKNTSAPASGDINTYYVNFVPNADILTNGTNPLFLVEDFKPLGNYIALPDLKKIPVIKELDPEKCYVSWEIILATKEDEEKIHEIFIFAEDSCTLDIQKISNTDLVSLPEFTTQIKKESENYKSIGLEKVKEIVASLEEKEKKDTSSASSARQAEPTNGLKNISNIRVSSEKLDELINLVSELVTTQAGLSLLAEKINNKDLLTVAEDVEKLSRRLRDSTFNIRLIPIENMLTRFQRLIRELSHELKKDIVFRTEGTDIELDKNMIEGLIDPIMHILRNSIDHGIESSEERAKQGKSSQGVITFKAYYSGSNVYIQIGDDGAGIDVNRIRKQAVSKGLIPAEAELSEKEILDIIFLPGFSTAKAVTNISGRGVGMDVVKKKIADLRGEINIETKVNEGTTITLKLPLTLSIIDGLLVEIDDSFFVIPLASVNKCFEFRHEALANAVNNLIYVNDGHIPFIYLRNEFGFKSKNPDIEQVVVIEYGDVNIGLSVDKVVGEYQAVLKSLGSMYKKQDIISGATILGDGTVALVIDPNKIISQFNYQNQKDIA